MGQSGQAEAIPQLMCVRSTSIIGFPRLWEQTNVDGPRHQRQEHPNLRQEQYGAQQEGVTQSGQGLLVGWKGTLDASPGDGQQ